MLLAWAEYVQYVHPVDEVLLQRLEWAEQPVSATVAFLWDDLAIMVVEGLLDQIKLMRRQRVSMLEQIECVGKRKAPAFEELMVEPKQARAPSQHPQELAWAPACTKAAAASKGKGKIVPTLSDKSDYGESLSEHKRESEEEESAAQRFQHVQYNKKLAAKKASKAKAEAALQHRAINDFSGCIPNRLGVKVWGLLDVEQLNSCFTGALSNCVYYSVHNNAIFVRANANWAVAFEYSSQQQAKMPASLVYKFAPRGFPRTPYELERLYKHYANEHAPHHDRVVVYLLINELLLVAQKLNESLLDKTMWALLYNPIYRDLQSPIWGEEDKDFVVPRHILTCFTHVKEDGMTALHVMRTPDPSQPFDLKQIAQYVLIFGWLGLENTWQGIAFDFAYRMHWQTLFGFALCQALCATSAAKPAVVRWLALVMA
ncbi:hypothetical protein C0995_007810 [Termitomyces sp. Mi166|nr:hypothetical protein C0995_007810 [Termitomyces sp. Mi166\